MSEKLLVPDIGDFEEVEVIEVLAKQGDQLNICLLYTSPSPRD